MEELEVRKEADGTFSILYRGKVVLNKLHSAVLGKDGWVLVTRSNGRNEILKFENGSFKTILKTTHDIHCKEFLKRRFFYG